MARLIAAVLASAQGAVTRAEALEMDENDLWTELVLATEMQGGTWDWDTMQPEKPAKE